MTGMLMNGLPHVKDGEVLGGNFHPKVFERSRLEGIKVPVSNI